jgi:hypothetical protein
VWFGVELEVWAPHVAVIEVSVNPSERMYALLTFDIRWDSATLMVTVLSERYESAESALGRSDSNVLSEDPVVLGWVP